MIDWTQRNPGPELLDGTGLADEDLFQNYRELHIINKRLGGYAVTLKGIASLLGGADREYSILDVGCGGGDMLNEISKWGKKRGYRFELTGVDRSSAAIRYSSNRNRQAHWIEDDACRFLNGEAKFDIITCTLFMHHFTDEKITEMLTLMNASANLGVVINDLHRHPFAYYNIRWLTKLFSRSHLVKNDAPLSVLRGFRREDWKQYTAAARVKVHTLKWAWAFRYLTVIKTGE
jgi:2-polyprenyl-3-methyl-5-hydroxy-6-metoxy-1,4-benzoquinol methylase